MMRDDARLEPELEALLTPRKIERQVPPAMRARVLARARAFVAAGGWMAPAQAKVPEPIAAPLPRAWPALKVAWLASAAVAAIAAGAVGTVLVLGGRTEVTAPAQGPAPASPSALVSPLLPTVEDVPQSPVAPASALPSAPRSAHGALDSDPFAAELDVIARAQAAVTRRDFPRALTLIAEHARRFPSGHLTEEREALRVRSLLGSGRSEEGQRAAAAFARRFPRSVLLPRAAESPSRK